MAVTGNRAWVRCGLRAFAFGSAVLLAACGGGSSSPAPSASGPSAGDPPQTPAPAPDPVPQPAPAVPVATTTVAGTAATGTPLAGALITMKCAGDPGATFAATADAAGAFRVELVPDSVAPCLLRARLAQTIYVSPVVALGPGTVTVNATPLTHLLSSRLLGQSADLAYESADAAALSRITAQAVSAARGTVGAQLDRLGIAAADLSQDWVGQAFVAGPADPMDQALERVGAALGGAQLTVATAAAQLATPEAVLTLPSGTPPAQAACTPALLDGFAGADRTKWTKVGDADAVGIGGGPGLLRNASVEIVFRNGFRLAQAKTDAATGMVTLVPCELAAQVPALITVHGEPGSGASYYDAGRGSWASFEGETLHGLIQRFEQDRNIAVTPLTEAQYQRVLALGASTQVAGGLALKSVDMPWHDAARVQVAHDEVLGAINDQLPGIYRLSQLDQLPVMLGQQTDVEGSAALPKNAAGVYGAVLVGLAKTAAANRPDDSAPALTLSHRFSADLADGRLDDPLTGLDPTSPEAMLPAYGIDRLWRGLTTATVSTVRRVGAAGFRTDRPFPLALVQPSGYRNGDMFARQYIGLFSDGMLRIVAEVTDSDVALGSGYCYRWCNPVARIRASDTTQWWVFEIAAMTDFDPDSGVGRLTDGSVVRVNHLNSSIALQQLLEPLSIRPVELLSNVRSESHGVFAYRGADGGIHRYAPPAYAGAAAWQSDYPQARGLRSLAGMEYNASTAFGFGPRAEGTDVVFDPGEYHLFGIDARGDVQRLVYQVQPIDSQGARPSDVFMTQGPVPLPGRARQLSSDGRLVYALLTNGDVYLLNPEILESGVGFRPIAGVSDGLARHFYAAAFEPAGLPAGTPTRIAGAQGICWLGGVDLVGCDGRLWTIDRVDDWVITDIGMTNLRAPGDEVAVVPVTGIDARGWRAFKAPLVTDFAWDDAYLRLLATTDGHYVLQSDSYGVRTRNSAIGTPRTAELTQAIVESWFPDSSTSP